MILSTLGPAVVVGLVGFAAVRALGRNPSAAARIFVAMIIAFIFAEAIAIMAILMVFNLFK
jgi:F-type H+-transporting ATPase subunit c